VRRQRRAEFETGSAAHPSGDAASRAIRTSGRNLGISKRPFITTNRSVAVRLTSGDGDPAINEETKLKYTFTDAYEGLPRRIGER
jgi:hypothetical protein